MTIIEFLLARIAEDLQQAEDYWPDGDDGPGTWLGWIKADCKAKRRIVSLFTPTLADEWRAAAGEYDETAFRGGEALLALVSVYAGHPDIDEAWWGVQRSSPNSRT